SVQVCHRTSYLAPALESGCLIRMLVIPPRTTLFPYTTLFRSRRGSARRAARRNARLRCGGRGEFRRLAARRGRPALIGGRAPCCDLTGRPCSRHVGGKIRTWLFGRDTPAAHRKRLFGSVHHEMGGALEVVPERAVLLRRQLQAVDRAAHVAKP